MSEHTPDLSVIDGEAPQIAQEATEGWEGVPMPPLEELGARARTLVERKGMTGGERMMVLDGYTVDTFAQFAAMHVNLMARVVDLMRLVSQLVGNPETPDLEPVDVPRQTAALREAVAKARLQAEIDYLESKPDLGPRLLVP